MKGVRNEAGDLARHEGGEPYDFQLLLGKTGLECEVRTRLPKTFTEKSARATAGTT